MAIAHRKGKHVKEGAVRRSDMQAFVPRAIRTGDVDVREPRSLDLWVPVIGHCRLFHSDRVDTVEVARCLH
jgi:hypothetical protein